MTQKQFDEIRERARVFPYGVPSQVQTDIAELIAERLRIGGPFEPSQEEQDADAAVAQAKIDAAPAIAAAHNRTSGARKK